MKRAQAMGRSVFVAAAAAAALFALQPDARAETYTLRIGAGHPLAVADYIQVAHSFFIPEVQKRVANETDHEVKFIEAWAGSVAGVNEILTATQQGVLDIGLMIVMFEPTRLHAQNFNVSIPFTTPDAVTAINVVQKVYDDFPVLAEDYQKKYGQKQLALCGGGNYQLATDIEWKTVDDLQGKKLGAAGPNLPWLQGTGVTAVQASLNEAYTSVQTGVFDGYLMFPAGYLGSKLYEVAPYYAQLDFGSIVMCTMTMSNKSIEKLPPDVVKIIEEVGREYQTVWAKAANENHDNAMAKLDGIDKVTIYGVPAEQRAAWAERVRDLPRKRAQEMNDLGYPGTEIMKSYMKHMKEAGYDFPVDYTLE